MWGEQEVLRLIHHILATRASATRKYCSIAELYIVAATLAAANPILVGCSLR
jgi:hypothetical protein